MVDMVRYKFGLAKLRGLNFRSGVCHNGIHSGSLMPFWCSSRIITDKPSITLRTTRSRTHSQSFFSAHVNYNAPAETSHRFQVSAMSLDRSLSPEGPLSEPTGPGEMMDASDLFSGSMPKEEIGALRFLKVR
jgi:hypothetical protein